MELKEYIQIFRKDFKIFLATIIMLVLAVFIYSSLQPISFTTSLTLEVTRMGSQNTQDYKFDDFYCLQADERFAETIVQWLKSPAIVSEIYKNSELDASGISLQGLKKTFEADRLSSQIVAVSYSTISAENAGKISNSIVKILKNNTENLNRDQNQNNWFKLNSQEPVIVRNINYSWLYFLASILAGIFIGFWVVMVRHYLK